MAEDAAPFTVDEIERFLIEEAALLDEWRLEEWLALMAEDCRYLVPPLDKPDADHRETLALIFVLEFHEPGHLLDAAMAPSGPEVEQHDFAFVAREVDGSAFGIFASEIGRWLSGIVVRGSEQRQRA